MSDHHHYHHFVPSPETNGPLRSWYDTLMGRITPDPEVIARLDAIDHKLDLIQEHQEIEMALADDLNNAVTSLATAFNAEHDAVTAEMKALTDALAAVPATDPALATVINQTVANIATITGSMAKDAAALTASIPAATTVPAPVITPPTVPPTVTPPTIATPPVTDPAATPPSTPPASATTT